MLLQRTKNPQNAIVGLDVVLGDETVGPDLPDNHFAVQLIAAQHIETITHYLQNYPQQQTIQLRSVVNDEQWHILLLGVYPSYKAASFAVNAMSTRPPTPPWIRPIGPLKQSVIPAQ